jgi:hypothetical protein
MDEEFLEYLRATKRKPEGGFVQRVRTMEDVRKTDRSKIKVPQVSDHEVDFEDCTEVPAENRMTYEEVTYWRIRQRTALPEKFRRMARVHVSLILHIFVCFLVYSFISVVVLSLSQLFITILKYHCILGSN